MTATTVNDTNFYYEDVGVCVCVCALDVMCWVHTQMMICCNNKPLSHYIDIMILCLTKWAEML